MTIDEPGQCHLYPCTCVKMKHILTIFMLFLLEEQLARTLPYLDPVDEIKKKTGIFQGMCHLTNHVAMMNVVHEQLLYLDHE